MSNTYTRENPLHLTTDATPDAPRKDIDGEEHGSNNSNTKPKPKVQTPVNHTVNMKKKTSNHSSQKKATSQSSRNMNASAKVVTIVNSNNVHVGTINNYNLFPNKTSKNWAEKVPYSDQVKMILKDEEVVSHRHMDYVASHLMDGWQRVGDKLGFSPGQLDHIYNDNKDFSSKEIVYQMLRMWTEERPTEARVHVLAQTLWDAEQHDLVAKWAEHLYTK